MAPTVWKFVDQPVASPSVLLDMNNGSTWKTLGGEFLKLPSPPLRRSIAQNAMSDGGIVSSASYDLRTIDFTLELTGTSEAARETQVDQVKAQLAKPGNLLMYQSELSANPVFFRTLRSDEYVLDKEFIPGIAWRMECHLLAEPFAIGVRRDLAQVTITNDPAGAGNPIFWDVTGIVGDSPTPAFLKIGNAFGGGNPCYLAQRTQNSPTALTLFAQAEAGTVGTDTTVQANDANMSGAGSNFVRTTFATATLTTRLTVTVPTASDAAALRGRYRVLVRVRTSATGSNFSMRFLQNSGLTNPVTGQIITFDSQASGTILHYDLGIIDFPVGGPTPQAMGYSGIASQVATQPLGIQVGRNSGTATLDIDYVHLLPADERLSVTARSAFQANSFIVVDGPNEMAYGMPSGTTPFGATRTIDNAGGMVSLFGGAPMLVPGTTNRLYMLRGGSAVSTTSTVDVSYWPRWREVATS